MPSGNCVIYKNGPHRPKMANTAYEGHECQVGRGSEEGRGDRTWPYMEHLWRIWHKQGPSSQSTCTIILDKTTKYVMKIIQFSLSAYILKANQIIAWRFFQPEQKLTVTVLAGGSETGRHVLQTGYNDHLLRATGQTRSGLTVVCEAPGLLLRPSKYPCGPWIVSNGMEVRSFSFYYTRMWIKM